MALEFMLLLVLG